MKLCQQTDQQSNPVSYLHRLSLPVVAHTHCLLRSSQTRKPPNVIRSIRDLMRTTRLPRRLAPNLAPSPMRFINP